MKSSVINGGLTAFIANSGFTWNKRLGSFLMRGIIQECELRMNKCFLSCIWLAIDSKFGVSDTC
jgi:hypothetical protein